MLMTELFPLVSLLVVAGGVSGFVAGLFGVGGGIVMVPTLFWVFGHYGVEKELSMAMAVSTSLAVIVPTAISSSYSHYKLGSLDKRLSLSFLLPIVIGVFVGGHFIVEVKSQVLFFVFAILTLVVSIVLLLPKKHSLRIPESRSVKATLGFSLGCSSVIAGVGGGAIGAPILMAMGRGSHVAVGTAASFGVMISIPGVIFILVLGQTPVGSPMGTLSLVNVPAFFALSLTSVFVAPLGARMAHRLSAIVLRRCLCVILILVGIKMLISGLQL